MTGFEPPRISTHRAPVLLAAGLVVVVVATVAASPGDPLLSSASSSPPVSAPLTPSRLPVGRDRPRHALGTADGVIPDGTTVVGDAVPGVANLDPDLLRALRRAAADAANDGMELFVASGWRSKAYQERLLREAIATYGSAEEAARWVATPSTSLHVSGDAVDVGPSNVVGWLSEHGAQYGLCQVYRNEPWHYELRPAAIDQGCPPPYADPTHDPRMQR